MIKDFCRKKMLVFQCYLLLCVMMSAPGIANAKTKRHDTECYPDFPIRDGLLCYPKCKRGYANYGEGPVCWAKCPKRTTDIGISCQKDTYGRGVGVILSTCRKGTEKSALLCYPLCKPGYYGVGPVCWKQCEKGYVDVGALCGRPLIIYGRDTSACPWYDKCGLCDGPWYNICGKRRKCGGKCKPGYTNDGCTCRRPLEVYAKKSYGRGVGEVLWCAPDQDQSGALCYPKCKPGYYGVGPLCWANCNGETYGTGAYCQKKAYGRGVGRVLSCLSYITKAFAQNVNTSGIIGFLNGVKEGSLTKAVCSGLWSVSKPVMIGLSLLNVCQKHKSWNTMMFTISGSGSAVLFSGGVIGVAFDVRNDIAVCYVQRCTGFRFDVGIGVAVNFGWFRSLDDIPGESRIAISSVEVPFTETGISFEGITNANGSFIGALGSVGFGGGLSPLPFDVGEVTCDTPKDKMISLITP